MPIAILGDSLEVCSPASPDAGREARIMTIFLLLFCLASSMADAQRTARLSGKVVDHENRPIHDALITAHHPEATGAPPERRTNKKGRFHLIVTPPPSTDCYNLHIVAAGYDELWTAHNLQPGDRERRTFVLYPVGYLQPTNGNRGARFYNQAVDAYKLGDLANAEQLLYQSIEHDPKLGLAYAALSELLFLKGKYQQAVILAERSLEIGGDNKNALQTLYEAYSLLHEAEKARAAILHLAAAGYAETSAVYLYNEAVEAIEREEFVSAQKLLEEACAFDPNRLEIQNALADVERRAGQSAN